MSKLQIISFVTLIMAFIAVKNCYGAPWGDSYHQDEDDCLGEYDFGWFGFHNHAKKDGDENKGKSDDGKKKENGEGDNQKKDDGKMDEGKKEDEKKGEVMNDEKVEKVEEMAGKGGEEMKPADGGEKKVEENQVVEKKEEGNKEVVEDNGNKKKGADDPIK